MAGFEKGDQLVTASGLERVSLRVTGSSHFLEDLPAACRVGSEGLAGIIYSLPSGNVEVIAEGERVALDGLVSTLQGAVDAEDGAEMHLSWQPPVGGYSDGLPLVVLQGKMRANIELHGSEGTLEYYIRHLQVEAVFNRGLALQKKRQPAQLDLSVSGDSARIKSFVRWCQRGPPLDRAERCVVSWSQV